MPSSLTIGRRQFLAGAAVLGTLAVPKGPLLAQSARRGGTLRISVDQAINKLNPLVIRVSPEYLVAEMLYSSLTRLGLDMAPVPDLAESWSNSPDLSEWTFRLRRGVTFHDGTHCTAKDVVATFETILDPSTSSSARQNVGPIEAVRAIDELTVLFKTKAPYADLPVAVAFTNAKILPASVIKSGLARLDREPIGTGPFKLVSFEPERLVSVQRNPTYYDKGRPYLDRVQVAVYPDPTAEVSALIAGDTDLMLNSLPTEFRRLQQAAGVQALRTPSGQFCNINFGCDTGPFSDPRARQALALALDRKALVDLVAEGYGTPGNDTPINSAYPFHADMPLKQPDTARAKKLLAEAGHAGGLEATLIASDRPAVRTQLAVAVREMAKGAGFTINVQTMPHSTYLDRVWKKGSFYIGFYNMQPTADAIFSLLYTSNAAWNETRWNNAAFDRLVNQARTTVEDAKRRDLYALAQKLMHEQVPSIIPVFFDLLAAKRNYVEGYQLHPRGAVFRVDHVWLGNGAPRRG